MTYRRRKATMDHDAYLEDMLEYSQGNADELSDDEGPDVLDEYGRDLVDEIEDSRGYRSEDLDRDCDEF